MTPDQAPKPEPQATAGTPDSILTSGGDLGVTAEIPSLPESISDTSDSGGQSDTSEITSTSVDLTEVATSEDSTKDIPPKADDATNGDFAIDTTKIPTVDVENTVLATPQEDVKMPDAFGDHQATANSVDTQQNAQEGQEQAAVVNSATSPNGTDSSRVSPDSPLMRVHEDITTKYPKQTAPKGFWARLFGRNK